MSSIRVLMKIKGTDIGSLADVTITKSGPTATKPIFHFCQKPGVEIDDAFADAAAYAQHLTATMFGWPDREGVGCLVERFGGKFANLTDRSAGAGFLLALEPIVADHKRRRFTI